jgi:hypothetical protein
MWWPCFFYLEAKAECHGILPAPSGTEPGGDAVDPEQKDGLDRVSGLQMKVHSVNVQGLVCNFFYVMGPVVIPCVSPLPN